jgi:RHS repeat-associated protein
VYTVTNAAGHITTFNSYDSDGRPTQVTDANGIVTSLTYGLRGWLASRSAAGETTGYDYDAAGNLSKVTLPDGSWVLYFYDAANNLISVGDSLGSAIDYQVDAMGNRVRTDTYDPQDRLVRTLQSLYDQVNRLQVTLDAAGQQTTYGYDTDSNPTKTTDPLGRATVNSYDPLNRLTQINDAANGNTNFTYDAKDRLKTVQDPRGLTTTYTYDNLGNLTTQASPDTGNTTFTYDAAGNVLTSTDARSITTTYTYDPLNRVLTSTVTDGTVSYEYDNTTTGGAYAKGRLTKITDPSGFTTYGYDSLGRVTGKSQSVNATVNKTFSVVYGYSMGRQVSTTYPSGHALTYGFNSQGQVTSISVDGTAILSGAQYSPFGPVAGWTWANGEPYQRTYDLNGRVDTLTLGPSTGTYSDLSQTFGYDTLYRLTSAAMSATQVLGYGYDANGNRTSATVNGTSTTYNYPGNSHRLSSLTGAGARSFTYDASGHLTLSGITYVYDGRGRMKQAGSVTYLVNGLGQRVKKTAAADVFFAYDESGHLIGEYDATGAPIQETVWLGDLPIAVIKPNGVTFTVFYVWPDHLGTPRVITDSTNAERWEWAQNDPFGNNAPNENPSGAGTFTYNLRFPGQYYDVDSGLNYNYFRDYDPSIGRYVESDPIGLKGGINTYGYVFANPLALLDPLGLTPADVQGVGRDVGASFTDIHPGQWGIGFQPMQPGQDGATDNSDGQTYVDPSWADKACFTRKEYENLFFTIFHEYMHSSDPLWRRLLTSNSSDDEHHNSIYQRELYERYRPRKPGGDMWGTPREYPLDIDRLYNQYRKRTPKCNCGGQ